MVIVVVQKDGTKERIRWYILYERFSAGEGKRWANSYNKNRPGKEDGNRFDTKGHGHDIKHRQTFTRAQKEGMPNKDIFCMDLSGLALIYVILY